MNKLEMFVVLRNKVPELEIGVRRKTKLEMLDLKNSCEMKAVVF